MKSKSRWTIIIIGMATTWTLALTACFANVSRRTSETLTILFLAALFATVGMLAWQACHILMPDK